MSDQHPGSAPNDPSPASEPSSAGPSDATAALQQAAIGAIEAMRGLLDAAEEVVADPGRVDDLVTGVSSWAERLGEHLAGDPSPDPATDAHPTSTTGEAPSSAGASASGASPRGPRRVPLD